MRFKKAALFLAVPAALVLFWAVECPAKQGFFAPLKTRLIELGFTKAVVEKAFANPNLKPDLKTVYLYLGHAESKLDYGQFLSKTQVKKAAAYMKRHKKALGKAEKTYGADKEVITAIMLVESGLGAYVGGRRVLVTLSTLAALGFKENRDAVWSKRPKHIEADREKFDAWAERKSKWATREMEALLIYCSHEKIDPYTIKGSFAGAFGYSQFLPSSAIRFAKDGNRDGRINLFVHEDAIASVANYLKSYGWSLNMKDGKAKEVLLQYNKSTPYVTTILELASRLKG